ncbi:MAG TPA: imidazole glycerol phosphate synthase subunit HisH [Fimbriimonadaceae bacterium]|nr:imidazole glycerol phosphate synthase subunit HisH [Fimbriimonadaceae bacterium]
MITIVDYGAGNLRSVSNALVAIGKAHRFAASTKELEAAEKILLPGVGHFGQMMNALARTGLDRAIRSKAAEGVPLLGICLGMQALFESSEESPGTSGLGLLSGEVIRFKGSLKIPHMGWNRVRFAGAEDFFYFANSFYVPLNPTTTGISDYGQAFSASVKKDNVEGFQFHPEKSGAAGLRLLAAWCERC